MSERKTHSRPATAQQIKAFAHPLRMQLYRLLSDQGQATASVLARETGESSGQTSYHLRQLAKFGFVEEVAGEGTGRERWWRAVGFTYDKVADPDTHTVRTLNRWMIDNQADTLHAAVEALEDDPEGWRDASVLGSTSAWLTRDELEALSDELLAVVERHTEEAKGLREAAGPTPAHLAARPDERRVRVYVSAVPLPSVPGDAAAIGAGR